jgi:DNA repair protein RecO (recombination protein O)
MSTEKASAIVLRVVEFSETSCVLTLFTDAFGKVRALAKGARRPKSPFESALDLLATCRIVFLRKSTEALDLLTEAKLERRFRVGRGDLGPVYAGYYVAELLDALTDDYDPHPELYAIAESTLAELSNRRPPVVVRGTTAPSESAVEQLVAPPVVSRLVFHFELAALRILGHLPSLEVCVGCGSPVSREGRVAFGHIAGGVLCPRCREGQRSVVSISGAAVESMKALANMENERWRTFELSRGVHGELRGTLSRYLAHLLGRETKLQPYLGGRESFSNLSQ